MLTGTRFTNGSAYVRKNWQERTLSATQHQANAAICEYFSERFGTACRGIVLYGSYLRGQTDSLLDAYILIERYRDLPLPRWHAWLGNALAPNVYQCAIDLPTQTTLRLKYAIVTLDQFEDRIEQGFHSYFWARFAQPTLLIGADDTVADRIARCCATAGARMLQATVPLLPTEFDLSELWRRALSQTYACELRAESSGRSRELVQRDHAHYLPLTTALAHDLSWFNVTGDPQRFRAVPTRTRHVCERRWQRRRWLGKALSVARLMKASFTFNDGLDYLLWKIERHSGVQVDAPPRAHRYPLLFAWPVVWRAYRRGAFR